MRVRRPPVQRSPWTQSAVQLWQSGRPRGATFRNHRAAARVGARLVDGVREVERELNAGDRIPLRAGRTSVIRAGNAGAVRLTIDGEDRGLLGPEGEVVTRTLQIPATPNR